MRAIVRTHNDRPTAPTYGTADDTRCDWCAEYGNTAAQCTRYGHDTRAVDAAVDAYWNNRSTSMPTAPAASTIPGVTPGTIRLGKRLTAALLTATAAVVLAVAAPVSAPAASAAPATNVPAQCVFYVSGGSIVVRGAAHTTYGAVVSSPRGGRAVSIRTGASGIGSRFLVKHHAAVYGVSSATADCGRIHY